MSYYEKLHSRSFESFTTETTAISNALTSSLSEKDAKLNTLKEAQVLFENTGEASYALLMLHSC